MQPARDSRSGGERAHFRPVVAPLRFFKRMWRPFLSGIGRVLAQSEIDAVRLRTLGCGPERVTVSGNLKFDVRAAVEAEATRMLKAGGGAGSWWQAARSKARKRRC